MIKSFQRWIPGFFALAVVVALYLPHFSLVHVKPIQDEVYHITDAVADGKAEALNPFSNDYKFLGHPPGYPMSLYLWMRIAGKTYVQAHYHALAMTIVSTFALFLFSSLFLTSFSSICVAFIFSLNYIVRENTERSLASMGSVGFIFLAMYFLAKERYRVVLAISLLGVFFRECEISIPVAILGAAFIVERGRMGGRPILWVTGLPILFLGIFFLMNMVLYGSFSRHPYALGTLGHFNDPFFHFGGKWETFNDLLRWLSMGFPHYVLFALLGVYVLLLKPGRVGKPSMRMALWGMFLSTLFHFAFYSMYGDIAPRDLLSIIAATSFFLVFSFERLMPKYISGLAVAFVTAHLTVDVSPEITLRRERLREEAHMLEAQAHYIENVNSGKNVCVKWPLSSSQQIHGYFKNVDNLKVDCEQPELVCFDSYMMNPEAFKTQQKLDGKTFIKVHSENFPKNLDNSDIRVFFECWHKKTN